MSRRCPRSARYTRSRSWRRSSAARRVAAHPAYHLPGDGDRKARALYGANPFPESRGVAAFVARHSDPADELFVFGSEPQLQFLARRANAGRYLLAYHYLLGPPEDALARQREVLTTLRASPPRFVATALYPTTLLEDERTPRAIHEGLEALLRARYRPVAELRLQRDGEWTFDTRPEALAPWRVDPRLLLGDRSGFLVLYEREAPATRP